MPFAEFKKVYTKVPKLSVEVIILEGDKILLTRRAIAPAIGLWHTPGGTVLKGEKIQDTAKRVAKEEIGLTIDVIKLLGYIEYSNYENEYEKGVALALLVAPKGNKKIVLDAQSDKYDYFSELPKNTLRVQRDFFEQNLGLKVSVKKY